MCFFVNVVAVGHWVKVHHCFYSDSFDVEALLFSFSWFKRSELQCLMFENDIVNDATGCK